VPAGTKFNTPSDVIAIQALIITATVTVFFAAISGCADAGVDESGNIAAAGLATVCSLISWVLAMAAYSVYASFDYIQSLQTSSSSQVWVPTWVNQGANQMTAVKATNTVYGPGFGTAITASILIFFANVIHCASLRSRKALKRRMATGENVTPGPMQDGTSATGKPVVTI
jgi:hypothetical protein